MHKLLTALRKKRVQIDYKAILTPTNSTWDVLHVYLEMAKEKAMYEKMEKSR